MSRCIDVIIDDAYYQELGRELAAITTGVSLLVKPKVLFQEAKIGDVAACLKYAGKQKMLNDREQAVQLGVKEQLNTKVSFRQDIRSQYH